MICDKAELPWLFVLKVRKCWRTEAVTVAAAAVLMQGSVSTCVDCATTRAWRSRTWTVTRSHRFTWWRLVTSVSSAQKASYRRWTWSNTDRTNIQLQTPPSFMYQLLRPTPKFSDAADTSADVCWVNNGSVKCIGHLWEKEKERWAFASDVADYWYM